MQKQIPSGTVSVICHAASTGYHVTPFQGYIFLSRATHYCAGGNVLWMWVVSDFEEDSFYDGEVYNPPEYAKTLDKLLVNTTE
jgi:hypothetical protein